MTAECYNTGGGKVARAQVVTPSLTPECYNTSRSNPLAEPLCSGFFFLKRRLKE